jgi:hypothetical protein
MYYNVSDKYKSYAKKKKELDPKYKLNKFFGAEKINRVDLEICALCNFHI